MTTPPPPVLTARTIADRLGRGVVRACYPPVVDRDGTTLATIVTRLMWPDGELIQVFYEDDDPVGPRLTDLGMCVGCLADLGCRPDVDTVRAACKGTGVHYDASVHGALWAEVDVSWPEEDAAELVAVLLRLSGYALGRAKPKRSAGKVPGKGRVR